MTKLNLNSNKCVKNINFLFLLVSFLFSIAVQASARADNIKSINKSRITESTKGIHYKIFVLSGQSNGVGVAANTDFPVEYQAEETNVQIWGGMDLDASLTNQWINVKPGFGAPLTNSGCELSFAKEISKRFPNDHIRIIKGAWRATSMVDYWLSPSAGIPAKQDFYHLLINSTIKPALNNITANGDSYELAGFLWMQGESDAIAEASAKVYESNLSNFINDIRKDLNVEKMPFIIAKIDATPSWPFNSIVRQAEDSVASKFQSVGIFDTHGFETDGVHYLAAGYVKMGIQFANQYINVLPKVYVSQIWDDAILNDLRLIDILKKYNAKATFAIDAGDLTEVRQPQAWVVNGTAFGKVSIDDVKNIFADFEVANHGLNHQALPTLTESERNKQIVDSKKLLESWLNRPINGFVYPGCPYDVASENAVKNAGHTWARTCENTTDFCSNTNAFEFRTTVPYNAANFWTEFNRIKATGGVFTFWGHTFFTTEAEWTDIESKIAQLSQDPAVIWTNTSELFNQFNFLCPAIVPLASTIPNGSFETPDATASNVGLPGVLQKPITSNWVFEGNSFIMKNGCAYGQPNAIDGVQCAAIQNGGDVYQNINFDAGTYVLTFSAAQRTGNADIIPIVVSVDGTTINTLTVTSTAYFSPLQTASFTVTAGVHKIQLTTTQTANDCTFFFDNLSSQIVNLSVPNFKATKFSIYPNPSSGKFTLNCEKNVESIKVIDMQGRDVYSNRDKFKGTKTYNISLTKGVYLINLTGEVSYETQKLIIE